MDLTPKNKERIDEKSYESLLYSWRFARIGDPWFQGETGKYWCERMAQKRAEVGDAEAVGASKRIGWER